MAAPFPTTYSSGQPIRLRRRRPSFPHAETMSPDALDPSSDNPLYSSYTQPGSPHCEFFLIATTSSSRTINFPAIKTQSVWKRSGLDSKASQIVKNVDVLFNTVYNPTPGGRFIEIYTEPEALQPGRTRPTVAPGLADAWGFARCVDRPPSDLLGSLVSPGIRPRCDPLSRLWRTAAPDRRANRSRIHSALSARRRATNPAAAA